MRRGAILLALLLVGTAPAVAADDAAMQAAADGFYGVYGSLHPSDGIPDAALRARFAPYLSLGLEGLLEQAGAAEARFAKANKGSPPLAEGDLFSSLFEGATSVSVGDCSGDARSGHCAVHLTYTEPAKAPVVWTDTLLLVNTPAGWRVDDIAYGGSWAFGNKGKLSETLRQAAGFP